MKVRTRTLVKAALSTAFVSSGLAWGFARLRRRTFGPRVIVLGYHRVVDRIPLDGPSNPSLCISSDHFRRQMLQLRERFEVLPLAHAVRAIRGELRLTRDACTITFDDGYHDVYARARPILRELAIPAAVFVPSGFVDSPRPLSHDRLYTAFYRAGVPNPAATVERFIAELPAAALERIADELEARTGAGAQGAPRVLSAAELRALADDGWEIGGHTVGHVVLTHEPPARVDRELADSRRALEEISQRECRYFAYCNGLYDRAVVAAVQRAGFEGALTTYDRMNRVGDDPLRIGRKVLWQAHTLGPDGRWSAALSAAHLADLFGTLGLTTPVDGEVAKEEPCAT
jgi:peptidoglycan/xylan/chitin deacetylase (PgdA/CDA1 family)